MFQVKVCSSVLERSYILHLYIIVLFFRFNVKYNWYCLIEWIVVEHDQCIASVDARVSYYMQISLQDVPNRICRNR